MLIVVGMVSFSVGYFSGQLQARGIENTNVSSVSDNDYRALLENMDERCNLKPDSGNCKAKFPRYFFDIEDRLCKVFYWGGCDGTVPFDTLDECRAICEIPSRR